jgi:haloalkane dehalogenase
VRVLDTEMAYVDVGAGAPVVFLHGNPTSSYLWRNVIPHVAPLGRCLAPDLVGMGDSGRAPAGSYRFVDHARYLDAWFAAIVPALPVTLVVHDWGSALGFDWASQNPDRVAGIAFMESIVTPITWSEFPADALPLFEAFRSSPQGEAMVLEQNLFIEAVLPGGILRKLSDEEMDHYRKPYLEPGESRRPTLSWPRNIAIDGEPADVVANINRYSDWLSHSDVPKLFINATPGMIIQGGRIGALIRSWSNLTETTVNGSHFVQEDSPDAIGAAVAQFVKTLRSK